MWLFVCLVLAAHEATSTHAPTTLGPVGTRGRSFRHSTRDPAPSRALSMSATSTRLLALRSSTRPGNHAASQATVRHAQRVRPQITGWCVLAHSLCRPMTPTPAPLTSPLILASVHGCASLKPTATRRSIQPRPPRKAFTRVRCACVCNKWWVRTAALLAWPHTQTQPQGTPRIGTERNGTQRNVTPRTLYHNMFSRNIHHLSCRARVLLLLHDPDVCAASTLSLLAPRLITRSLGAAHQPTSQCVHLARRR